MKNKSLVLVYDDLCTLCTWYTGWLVKSGLLPPEATLYPNFEWVKIMRFFDINICHAQDYRKRFSAFRFWRYAKR